MTAKKYFPLIVIDNQVPIEYILSMVLDIEIPVLDPFLEIRGFSIPPTYRELGGFPV